MLKLLDTIQSYYKGNIMPVPYIISDLVFLVVFIILSLVSPLYAILLGVGYLLVVSYVLNVLGVKTYISNKLNALRF